MNADVVRIARTLLFVPGNRPDRFAKADTAGADIVVIDLEDAVAPDDKDSARDAAAQWLSDGHDAVVRINGADTQWFDADVAMLGASGAPAMLAKAEDPATVSTLAATSSSVIPLVETAVGIVRSAELATVPGVARLAFGAIDFAAELGVDPDDREALLLARSSLVLASAATHLGSPVDGVTTALRDVDKLSDDVGYAARIGLRGKLCIHPSQVSTVHRCLAPSDEQVSWAQRIVDAARSDGSAVAVDGHMVDPPVVARAQQILAAARP